MQDNEDTQLANSDSSINICKHNYWKKAYGYQINTKINSTNLKVILLHPLTHTGIIIILFRKEGGGV